MDNAPIVQWVGRFCGWAAVEARVVVVVVVVVVSVAVGYMRPDGVGKEEGRKAG